MLPRYFKSMFATYTFTLNFTFNAITQPPAPALNEYYTTKPHKPLPQAYGTIPTFNPLHLTTPTPTPPLQTHTHTQCIAVYEVGKVT